MQEKKRKHKECKTPLKKKSWTLTGENQQKHPQHVSGGEEGKNKGGKVMTGPIL